VDAVKPGITTGQLGIEIDGMKSIQDVNKEIKRRIYNEEN
jgi:hypothetical protein